jgi:hypothetical protein
MSIVMSVVVLLGGGVRMCLGEEGLWPAREKEGDDDEEAIMGRWERGERRGGE